MLSKMQGVSVSVIGLVHNKRARLLLAFSITLIALGFTFLWHRSEVKAPQPDFAMTTIRLDGESFQAEIADTADKRQQGLAGKRGIPDNQAMLFIFEEAGRHCFWMKGVDFPIDILWFDASKRLVHQENSVAPDTYPESFCPPEPALYVVELKAGKIQDLTLSSESLLEIE